jgi:hypothetical protein
MLTDHLLTYFGRLSLFTWVCNSPAEIEHARTLGARVVLTDGDLALLVPKPAG